jgi:predicted NUDIX family NTP pyrophosphohydrolase
MSVLSAGILLHRRKPRRDIEILLVHPGGPYWAKKDLAAWSIPKGLIDPDEDPLCAARREFQEETGFAAEGPATLLGSFRLPSGKRLTVFFQEGDLDAALATSNRFEMEWPPKSGQRQSFPESDRARWFGRRQAMTHIVKGQQPILAKFFSRMAR